MSPSDRCAIVTGGTGALGGALVAAFLSSGHRVVVPWIVRNERDALAAAWEDARKEERLILVETDVTGDAGARTLLDAAGAPDVLVNGVGGFAGGQPVHETPLQVWDDLYRINLRSAVACLRAVLPGMCERRRGAIVNVASQAAAARPEGLAAYSASKSAVVVLTEIVQKEVAAAGVRVNAVAPGTIDTPANRAAMPEADRSDWTPPDRVAAVVHWLASPDATAVRGATVPV